MTLEQLKEHLLKDLAHISYAPKSIDELMLICKKRKKFCPDKLYQWFTDKFVAFKSNGVTFLMKYGVEDLNSGRFDFEKKEPRKITLETTGVVKRLRYDDFEVSASDSMYIDVYLNYMFDNGVDESTLKEFCDYAIKYCNKRKTKTAQDFLNVFRRSKFFEKKGYNVDELDAKCKEHVEEWENLLKSVENVKGNAVTAITAEDIEKFKSKLN